VTVAPVQGQLFAKTWADCYGCKVTFPNPKVCASPLVWNKQPCHARPFLTLSVSMYAAQLSWWFAHFPKSQFMFITSNELRKDDPLPVLNKVVAFMDMGMPRFRADLLKNVWGYNGGYNITDLSPLDLHTVQYLQLFYRQATQDLEQLLQGRADFSGIPPEIPESVLHAVKMPRLEVDM
jgi:hypothetical protein